MNKSSLYICCILIALSSIAFASSSYALGAVHRVPTQFATVGKALEAATAGDTVQVAEGVYFEHITLKEGVVLQGGWKSDFSHRNFSAYQSILDGIKEKGATVFCADKAVIDGFTIIHATLKEGSKEVPGSGSGIFCRGTSTTITNNIIRDNEPSGVVCRDNSRATISQNRIHDNAMAGIFVEKGSNVQIQNNTIWGNKNSGIGSSKEPISTIVARNNTIYDNERAGIGVLFAIGSIENNIIYNNKRGGIIANVTPLSIINNTIVGNNRAGITVETADPIVTIKNNIISHNKEAGIRANIQAVSNNLLFANNETGDCNPEYLWCVRAQYGGFGDENSYKSHKGIISDPLFIDVANHDYHLRGTSPAIDAGSRDKGYNDVHFPPSRGSEINDIGAFGGPYTFAESAKVNHAPVADSGSDQVLTSRKKTLVLDGQASSDPDGDLLFYKWQIISKPESSKPRLAKSEQSRCAIRVDKSGEYAVQLVVTDKYGLASKPSVVKIFVPENRPPVAKIEQVVSGFSTGDTIRLFGSQSKDPEGDPLFYEWSILFKPKNSNAFIDDPYSQSVVFQVDEYGGYTVQLIVNDGKIDSKPVRINVSTIRPVNKGIRNVPGEYLTIQAAIDAAQPGDNIVVEKGVYKELLVIDRNVNLIGKDWPVIDGGNIPGNRNVISIAHLGDRVGSVEGFVITGSGRGELGHGISIWDSSPTINNNRIFANIHGIGIHGSKSVTGKTKIYSNLVFNNIVGIGNGKESRATIYNNRVYGNHVVGIGSRGKSTPRIRSNYIYNNRIGIGAREVASPSIEGNHVFDNTVGIAISPLSTIKKHIFKDIIIHNNLIVNNDRVGIHISSFNLSKVVITNNTVDLNNTIDRRIQSGGVVLGFPRSATFTAVVENNIISNNKGAGLRRHTGSENYPQPGATLISSKNITWQNAVDYLGSKAGPDSVSVDPEFVSTDAQSTKPYVTRVEAGYKYIQDAFAELPAER